MDDGRLREVYAVAYPRLVGQLVGVTGDPAEAEDAVMEAFARAAPGRSSFHDADNPEAWLRTVAVNVARSRWRRVLREHVTAGQRDVALPRHPLDERARDDLFDRARRALQLNAVIALEQREHFLAGGLEQFGDLVNPNRCQMVPSLFR